MAKLYTKRRLKVENLDLAKPTTYQLYNGTIVGGPWYGTTYTRTVLARCEDLTSLSHPGPPFKEGGPFNVKRYEFRRSVHNQAFDYHTGNLAATSYKESINGPVVSNYTDADVPAMLTEADTVSIHEGFAYPSYDLTSWGATGFAKYSPLKPSANSGQALVELYRDGIPNIIQKSFKTLKEIVNSRPKAGWARRAGEDYLNTVFGWKPLVKDLQDIYKTWKHLNDQLAQIIRDNGKPVRREGTLYYNKDVDGGGGFHSYPSLSEIGFIGNQSSVHASEYLSQAPGYYKTTTTSERIWFSARFRYYIPDVTDDRWTRNAKLALFGLNPSPSLVYEVLPWSWLVDWFTNFGDVINNISKNGIADLYADYAYTMRHYRRDIVVTEWPVVRWGYGTLNKGGVLEDQSHRHTSQASFTSRVRHEEKSRIAASPFGFGLQLTDLSTRQLAILTALGLSRQNFI